MVKAYIGNNTDAPIDLRQVAQSPPPYPDKGVTFAGFYKQLLSGNEYRLIPQTKIIIHTTVTGLGSGSIYNVPEGKRLIVESMVLSNNYSGAGTDEFYITDGDSATIPPERIQIYYRFVAYNLFNPIFKPALEFSNSVWYGITTGNVDITIYGFLEDK